MDEVAVGSALSARRGARPPGPTAIAERALRILAARWGAPADPSLGRAPDTSARIEAFDGAVGLLVRMVLVAIARRAGVLAEPGPLTGAAREDRRGARERRRSLGVRPSPGRASGAPRSHPFSQWELLEASCGRLAWLAGVSGQRDDPRSEAGWLFGPAAFAHLADRTATVPDGEMAALWEALQPLLDSVPVAAGSPSARPAHGAPTSGTPSGGATSPRLTAADLAPVGLIYEAARQFCFTRARGGGGWVVSRGDSRRAAGIHYTPPALAAEVVRATLDPVVSQPPDARARPATGARQAAELRALRIADLAMGAGAFLAEVVCYLAPRICAATVREGGSSSERRARRFVIEHCVRGVDLDPVAAELARWSLWLLAADPAIRPSPARPAKPMAIARLGAHLLVGDALLGLGPADAPAWTLARGRAPSPGVHAQRQLAADWVMAERFAGSLESPSVLLERASHSVGPAPTERHLAQRRARARQLLGGRPCVHWPLQVADVIALGGFDAIVGNPPFLGGKRVSEVLGTAYNQWLSRLHPGASCNTDLVAHFFRRAFELLREGGCLGLIATNTIAQGDTCAGGLGWLVGHGATIYRAAPQVSWPGDAAVVVSLVHVRRGPWVGPRWLAGRDVAHIGPRLHATEPDRKPHRLTENRGLSFVGCYVLGMGFTFDDQRGGRDAWPLARMRQVLAADPRNGERILPYIGGEEVGDSPTHEPRRFVIDFGELDETEARRYPELFSLLEQRVKPLRQRKDPRRYPRMVNQWWKFWNARPRLRQAAATLSRVLVTPRVSQYSAFAFLPTNMVCSEQLVVFALDRFAAFALLQSSVHELWVRCFASTLGRGLRYTPSSCFETFPFPPQWRRGRHHALDRIGERYYRARADLMRSRGEGLTRTYARIYDPRCRDRDVVAMRRLRGELDRAVCDAYGWSDVELSYGWDGSVLPGVEHVELPRTVGHRYGLCDASRRELLTRLGQCNEEQHGRRDCAVVGRSTAAPAPRLRSRSS